ncbi:hypothetical protein OSTOST_08094, partial [Ostertagia ostertagi]
STALAVLWTIVATGLPKRHTARKRSTARPTRPSRTELALMCMMSLQSEPALRVTSQNSQSIHLEKSRDLINDMLDKHETFTRGQSPVPGHHMNHFNFALLYESVSHAGSVMMSSLNAIQSLAELQAKFRPEALMSFDTESVQPTMRDGCDSS